MRSLHGNTQGLKPNQLRRIEKLYQRRIPPHQVVTPEFARQLAELSTETGRQIGALIDRKGYVEYVIVGDARQMALRNSLDSSRRLSLLSWKLISLRWLMRWKKRWLETVARRGARALTNERSW